MSLVTSNILAVFLYYYVLFEIYLFLLPLFFYLKSTYFLHHIFFFIWNLPILFFTSFWTDDQVMHIKMISSHKFIIIIQTSFLEFLLENVQAQPYNHKWIRGLSSA